MAIVALGAKIFAGPLTHYYSKTGAGDTPGTQSRAGGEERRESGGKRSPDWDKEFPASWIL